MGRNPPKSQEPHIWALPLLCDAAMFFAWLESPRSGPALVYYANPHVLRCLSVAMPNAPKRAVAVADGTLMSGLLTRALGRSVQDLSLSFPGFAEDFFSEIARKNTRIALVGGHQPEAERAGASLVRSYPGLQVAYAGSGYADERSEEATLAALSKTRPDIALLSMGCPRQERFAQQVIDSVDFPMVLIACGAFVAQSARDMRHYPSLVARLRLRWLWRLLREPHILARVLRTYVPYCLWHGFLRQSLRLEIRPLDQENSA